MSAPMSRGEINRLGDRLRHSEKVSSEDLKALQVLRGQHADALDEVAAILRDELRLAPTSRLKTVGTLVDKLRRQTTMSLSRMQDIAGVRIVVGETREQQDRVVSRICHRFAQSKVTDRRGDPRYGYRAVHVIVRHGGCFVEIQVRTDLQDRWAQLVERLGDSWGRQLRYGEQPRDPEREVGGATRGYIWDVVGQLADVIDELEAERQALERAVAAAAQEGRLDDADPETRRELDTMQESMDRLGRRVREVLDELSRLPLAKDPHQDSADN